MDHHNGDFTLHILFDSKLRLLLVSYKVELSLTF